MSSSMQIQSLAISITVHSISVHTGLHTFVLIFFFITFLRTANDSPIATDLIYFRRENSTYCDRAALVDLAHSTSALRDNFTSNFQTSISAARIWTTAGVTSSLIWTKCKRFAQLFLIENPQVEFNTSQCFASPGSLEYYDDPCCNPTLTWRDYCSPHNAETVTFGVNDDFLATLCMNKACSQQVASSLAAVAQRIESSTCDREAVSALFSVVDVIGSGSGQIKGPCADAFVDGSDDVIEFLFFIFLPLNFFLRRNLSIVSRHLASSLKLIVKNSTLFGTSLLRLQLHILEVFELFFSHNTTKLVVVNMASAITTQAIASSFVTRPSTLMLLLVLQRLLAIGEPTFDQTTRVSTLFSTQICVHHVMIKAIANQFHLHQLAFFRVSCRRR